MAGEGQQLANKLIIVTSSLKYVIVAELLHRLSSLFIIVTMSN